MLRKNSTRSRTSKPSDAKAGVKAPATILNPRSVIEVASSGGGTVNDPSGTDNRPPGCTDDLDLLV